MDTHERQLWKQVFATDDESAQRAAALTYIRYMAQKAKNLTSGQRQDKQDIAIGISSCIAQQEWINEEREPLLETIASLTAQLEIHPDDEKGWDELFRLVAELS